MAESDPRNWMWAEACALIARAERMHQQFFQLASLQAASWEPPVDVLETEEALLITVALPGVEPADLHVSIDGERLIVVGVRRLPVASGAAVRRLEIPYGRFERRIPLPAGRFEVGRPELMNGCLLLSLAKQA